MMSGLDSYFIAIIAGLLIGNFIFVPLLDHFLKEPLKEPDAVLKVVVTGEEYPCTLREGSTMDNALLWCKVLEIKKYEPMEYVIIFNKYPGDANILTIKPQSDEVKK